MDANEFGRLPDGERMVWTGQPQQGLMLTATDMFMVPLSLFWMSGVIFIFANAATTLASVDFLFVAVPFMLITLYFAAGRFFADAWLRQATRYAVTNRRVLIVRSGLFPGYISVYLDRVPQIDISEKPNGQGTIRFGPPVEWNSRSMAVWMPSLDPTPQLLGIDDARSVYDQIQRQIPSRSRAG